MQDQHDPITRRTALKALGIGAAAAAWPLPGEASPTPSGDAFKMVFLTDTHLDMKCSRENLAHIAQWICANAQKHNIRYVAHQGDVGDRRGSGDIAQMLKASREALQPIMDAGIPLSVAIGNHDYDLGSNTRPCAAFNDPAAFGRAFYTGQPWFGGTFEEEHPEPGADPGGTVNHYVLQEIAGRPFLFFVLELYPRDKVLAWADTLARERFPNHEIIVTTHAYLHREGHLATGVSYDGFSRTPGAEYSNDGEEMWERYFRTWPNLRLISSGHFIDEPRQNYLAQTGKHGNTVHSHFWNYQNWGYQDNALINTRREGPNQAAMLKILELDTSGNQVHIRHYLPPANTEADPAHPNHHPTWG